MAVLEFLSSTDADEIVRVLSKLGALRAHFTNGIYAGEQKVFVPTNLACFQMISEDLTLCRPNRCLYYCC